MQVNTVHGTWSSRLVFLMAAVGAAVGLGNMWKFPYTAGVSGGGAFVIIYVVAIAVVAVPIIMAELIIGRRGRGSPVGSFGNICAEQNIASGWQAVGWVNIVAGFLILTFYSVIAGWALAYIPKAMTGTFTDATATAISSEFSDLLASPWELTGWHALFMALTVFIIARGVQKGIERAVQFLMPSLFVMLLVMVGYAVIEGDAGRAVEFLFEPDFSKIDANVVLSAFGQAFFSVSAAMGLLITYGAYLPEKVRIGRAAVIIAIADTMVAILAGIAIFPIVFANDLSPGSGPGLVFETLPIAFGQMPGGALFGTVFFFLLFFAALTSSIALLEPMVSWARERELGSRLQVAIGIGGVAWVIGLVTVLSFNKWSHVHPLGFIEFFEGKTIFDVVEYVASNIMLPLGGILLALFVGWQMSRKSTLEELQMEDTPLYQAWRVLVRFVAPAVILWVLVEFVRAMV